MYALHPAQLDNLIKMRALLADPQRWTKKAYARKADGTTCVPLDPNATCFCILGAQAKTAPKFSDKIKVRGGLTFNYAIFEALREQIGARSQDNIPHYQDAEARTHADVLDLLDRTIAAESKKCGRSNSTV